MDKEKAVYKKYCDKYYIPISFEAGGSVFLSIYNLQLLELKKLRSYFINLIKIFERACSLSYYLAMPPLSNSTIPFPYFPIQEIHTNLTLS